jgi:predicted dehydrogenase
MRIGFVGCGYTADLYMPSIKRYPQLELVAVTDRNQERAQAFGNYYTIETCPTTEELLSDYNLDLVVNLTNPNSHFEVTKKCLESGKHVYSEKPMTVTFAEAKTLVDLAKRKGLHLSAAPCGILGETAQTLWKALRANEIGTVRVVYAEFDDGPVQLQDPDKWFKPSGAPFPYRDEFQVGFPISHAGYYLTWFAAFFGPAKTVTAFSSCLWPDKTVVPGEPLLVSNPDISVACITFESGVLLRLTCSLIAPHNHSMQIIGDKGILKVEEVLNYSAPVYVDKYSRFKFKAQRYPIAMRYPFVKAWFDPNFKVYPPIKKFNWMKRNARHRQDYARGVAELANAIFQKRSPIISADFSLHLTELVCAIQNVSSSPYQVKTTFEPLKPMDGEALQEILSIDW